MRVNKVESTTVIQIQPFAESSAESICTKLAAAADANSECYFPSPYSPSTIDSQVSGSNISIYGQNLLRIHLANFALMNPTPMGGAYSASGNTSEKKPQEPQTLAFKSSDVSSFCNFICFHQWNHNFPRIMLFSKALQRQQGMAITSSLQPKQHPLTVGQSIMFSRPDLTNSLKP
ncbi:hypothetical protein NC651_032891 [Populus alba x Populus x berolinensis]|nr:hypothetical protein NC651_032891 [Populus alba x Populus x berolinensis]